MRATMKASILALVGLFATGVVSDFMIYSFEVERNDGGSLTGWQFFTKPPSCRQVEIAEVTTLRVNVDGTVSNLRGIEWENKMGHWKVYKRNPSKSTYVLEDVNGLQRGYCEANTFNIWDCAWEDGYGIGNSVIYCHSKLNADAVYG